MKNNKYNKCQGAEIGQSLVQQFVSLDPMYYCHRSAAQWLVSVTTDGEVPASTLTPAKSIFPKKMNAAHEMRYKGDEHAEPNAR